MSLKVWISRKPFPNTRENEMIASVIKSLDETFRDVDETIHLLCNFSIPAYAGRHRYLSTLDLAVLRPHQLTVLELKNYQGALTGDEKGTWTCETEEGPVVVKGGANGRNPFGQISDYHVQMIDFLRDRLHPVLDHPIREDDFRELVSALLVLRDGGDESGDRIDLMPGRRCWMEVVRVHELARAILERGNNSKSELTDGEMHKLIVEILQLREAVLIDGFPMVKKGSSTAPSSPAKKEEARPDGPKPAKAIPGQAEYKRLRGTWRSEKENLDKFTKLGTLLRDILNPRAKELIREGRCKDFRGATEILFEGHVQLRHRLASMLKLLDSIHAGETGKVKASTLTWSFQASCQAISILCAAPIPEDLLEAFPALREALPEERPSGHETPPPQRPISSLPQYDYLWRLWHDSQTNGEKLLILGNYLIKTLYGQVEAAAALRQDTDLKNDISILTGYIHLISQGGGTGITDADLRKSFRAAGRALSLIFHVPTPLPLLQAIEGQVPPHR